MYGNLRNTGIRVLHTYEDAHYLLKNTKPIRGRSTNCYPLGNRKKVDMLHMRIVEAGAGEGDVQCYLHNTPVVTFKKPTASGTEVSVTYGNWATNTTAMFIGEVLGLSARVFNNEIVVSLPDDGEYRIPRFTALQLHKDFNSHTYKAVNAENCYVHKTSRKAVNNIKKQYSEFITWYSGMCKLRGSATIGALEIANGREELNHNQHNMGGLNPLAADFPANANTLRKQMLSTSYEDNLAAFYTLVAKSGDTRYSYRNSNYNYNNNVNFEGYRITLKWMMDGLNEMLLGLHRDEVLVRTEVPLGIVKKDSNARFFEAGWDRYYHED